MSTPDNRDQIAYWNGDAAARWVAQQEEMDPHLAPFGRAALFALQAKRGERILDVGCGCGATTLDLSAAVGAEGAVVGVDVSAPMLARARVRAASLPQASFVRDDAAVLRADVPFDAVYSRF